MVGRRKGRAFRKFFSSPPHAGKRGKLWGHPMPRQGAAAPWNPASLDFRKALEERAGLWQSAFCRLGRQEKEDVRRGLAIASPRCAAPRSAAFIVPRTRLGDGRPLDPCLDDCYSRSCHSPGRKGKWVNDPRINDGGLCLASTSVRTPEGPLWFRRPTYHGSVATPLGVLTRHPYSLRTCRMSNVSPIALFYPR